MLLKKIKNRIFILNYLLFDFQSLYLSKSDFAPLITKPITKTSSINPTPGIKSGIKSIGEIKYNKEATIEIIVFMGISL